jgi:hypothetical protein
MRQRSGSTFGHRMYAPRTKPARQANHEDAIGCRSGQRYREALRYWAQIASGTTIGELWNLEFLGRY